MPGIVARRKPSGRRRTLSKLQANHVLTLVFADILSINFTSNGSPGYVEAFVPYVVDSIANVHQFAITDAANAIIEACQVETVNVFFGTGIMIGVPIDAHAPGAKTYKLRGLQTLEGTGTIVATASGPGHLRFVEE